MAEDTDLEVEVKETVSPTLPAYFAEGGQVIFETREYDDTGRPILKAKRLEIPQGTPKKALIEVPSPTRENPKGLAYYLAQGITEQMGKEVFAVKALTPTEVSSKSIQEKIQAGDMVRLEPILVSERQERAT